MEYEVIVNGRTVYRGTNWNTAGDIFQWYKGNKSLMKITEVMLICAEEQMIITG